MIELKRYLPGRTSHCCTLWCPRLVQIPSISFMAHGFVPASRRKISRAAHRQREASLWWALSRTSFATIILIAGGGAGAFGLRPAARWTNVYGVHVSARISRPRARWQLKSRKAESRGARSGRGPLESIGSEDNKGGMDESFDTNAIRMKIMEKAGMARREDLHSGQEWIMIDEDESYDSVNEIKEALVSSLGGDLPKADSVAGVDVSKLVEELNEDTDIDIAKFIDQEFDKGTSSLRALADELKTEQAKSFYADRVADELVQIFKEEEEKAAKEIEKRTGPAKAKLDRAKLELEEAMADAEEARRAFEGDLFLQLFSFRSKGPLRQAALVGAITIANQAVYQVILLADERGGSFAVALVGFMASAAFVWFYGYRPFSLK